MPRETRTIPLYQRRAASGGVRQQVAGVRANLKPGDDAKGNAATWLVAADTIGDLVPQPNADRMRGTDGVWWEVKEVGPLADGHYPCKCDRVAEG